MSKFEMPAVDPMNALFKSRYSNECRRVNRFMIWLMVAQWLAGIGFATFYSPLTWIGQYYEIHIHVWAAVVLGGAISGFSILWARTFPDAAHTRHVIAVSQMLWSALLIHLSGGRIETHFHVFASLAILSIYRDWKILITATIVVAIDHFIRGVFYPLSAFGIVTVSPYRWIEHAAWVLFEVSFLVPGCMRLRNEIRELCVRQTEIEDAKRTVDIKVEERTQELLAANQLLAQKTEEAEKLALVAQYTDNAVFITDGDSHIEWVNEGFTRITGYQLDEVKGERPFELQRGPRTDPETLAQLRTAIENKQGMDTEVVNYRKDGEEYWLAIEIRPIQDQDGNVSRFIAIQSDVSERKAMELSLAEKEQRIRSLVDNVPGAFYRCYAQDQEMIFVSRAIEKISGFTPEQFSTSESVSKLDLIHPEDKKRFMDTIEQATNNREPYEIEYRIIDRDQNTKWVWEQGQCLMQDDRLILDGSIFDITERMEAEANNRRLQRELVDASHRAGMAEVATGVLHNVGNILNSVNVSASLIQRQFEKSAFANLKKASGLIAEQQDDFSEFVRNDKRGQKLPEYIMKITDTLGTERVSINGEFQDLLSNIEHIKEIVNVQQSMAKSSGLRQGLDPQELVTAALTATKGSLLHHKIAIEKHVDDCSSECFVSDKHKILQILVNLVNNAKDALVEHDTPDPTISIEVSHREDEVVFRVRDNGIGIPAEKLTKIFQHGFTTKENGHGFGLHSCANAATQLGGTLTATSDGIGQGACFVLALPDAQHAELPAGNTP